MPRAGAVRWLPGAGTRPHCRSGGRRTRRGEQLGRGGAGRDTSTLTSRLPTSCGSAGGRHLVEDASRDSGGGHTAPPENPISALDGTQPAPTRERIDALDILRGVAVGGILLANVLVFFGVVFLDPELAASFPPAAADRAALVFGHVFVDAKFYSVFSLLFGIGFGLQLARGETAPAAVPRRLRILLLIGAVHAFLVWAGDILMLYALLASRCHGSRAGPVGTPAMAWFSLRPHGLYCCRGNHARGDSGTAPSDGGSGVPAAVMGYFEAMGTGGVKEAFVGNLVLLAGRWIDLIVSMRFPKVLGMFVLGLWTVRRGVALALGSHRPFLVRCCVVGWAVGLPANVIAAWSVEQWPYIPPSAGGLLGVAMQGIGVPLLALAYASSVALLVVDRHRFLNAFSPVGRMALTNYLMHSAICVVLSYGYGFGLWWHVGAATATMVAVGILLLQVPLSAGGFHGTFGRPQWLWRRLT